MKNIAFSKDCKIREIKVGTYSNMMKTAMPYFAYGIRKRNSTMAALHFLYVIKPENKKLTWI